MSAGIKAIVSVGAMSFLDLTVGQIVLTWCHVVTFQKSFEHGAYWD